jgi:hypothetical protein
MVFPDSPALSVLLLIVVLVVAMYGARSPAHRVIQGAAKAVSQACKLTADAMRSVHARLAERNREVLFSDGLQDAEHQIEQEFQRISASVERDLGGYPALHRMLSDQVQRIDEDYRKATDTPPALEGWKQTVQAAGEIAQKVGSPTAAGKAVDALRSAVEEIHENALELYREKSRERHRLLAKLMPVWRSMDATLSRVDKAVSGIFERSRHLDELMTSYRDIASRSDAAERALTTSSLTHFLISGFVLVIALLGGFINFQLIALPMSEMVGATSRIGSMQTSDVAALVIILVEISMGLFLMESLRITRLFPVVGRLDRRARIRMAWATFAILFVLAGIEASLAYMRDMLAADRMALTQTLAGAVTQRPEFMWIPSVGQMVMGFILPFALTFVAIPLESFVHAGRIVLGQVTAGFVRLLAFGVYLLGTSTEHMGKAGKDVYDMIIFLPLKVEELIVDSRARERSRDAVETTGSRA